MTCKLFQVNKARLTNAMFHTLDLHLDWDSEVLGHVHL